MYLNPLEVIFFIKKNINIFTFNMRNTKKMKRLRKRTIGGVKTSNKLQKTRSHIISYMSPQLTPTSITPTSRMGDLIKFSKSRYKSYVPMHISSFLGEDEKKLKEDFLEFVQTFEGELAIRYTRSGRIADVHRSSLTVTLHEDTITLTPKTIGGFIKGEYKKQRGLYNASFVFHKYTFRFSGSKPIPDEIVSFLRRFGVYTI